MTRRLLTSFRRRFLFFRAPSSSTLSIFFFSLSLSVHFNCVPDLINFRNKVPHRIQSANKTIEWKDRKMLKKKSSQANQFGQVSYQNIFSVCFFFHYIKLEHSLDRNHSRKYDWIANFQFNRIVCCHSIEWFKVQKAKCEKMNVQIEICIQRRKEWKNDIL